MALKVVWTWSARDTRKSIFKYYGERNGSPDYSRQLLKHFDDGLSLVAQQEMLGKPTDVPGVRCLFVLDYSLFYKTTAEELVVLSLWDNRRDPENKPF